MKCRSYAIAARAARFARAVASTIENGSPTERAFGDDAKENRARTTHVFVLSKGNNASAARELARLARHIAALPLDAKHRVRVSLAAAWHFRLGAVALGGEYLAAAAAAAASAARLEGEESDQALRARRAAPLARCARAISRGAKPGGLRVRRRRGAGRGGRSLGVRGGCERDGRMGVRGDAAFALRSRSTSRKRRRRTDSPNGRGGLGRGGVRAMSRRALRGVRRR